MDPVITLRGEVTLYTDQQRLFPGYQPRRRLSAPRQRTTPVSLITTLRNERTSLPPWLDSLTRQSRPPDEVVVVDGGSTDGSLEILRDFAARSPFPFTVLCEPQANIARGRNTAIAHARHPIIACTDLGATPRPDWLEKITAPFEIDPRTQVASGWSEVSRPRGLAMRLLGLPLHKTDPRSYLPSSRSIAFTRAAWEAVGGYPEWLTLTAEDTWFDRSLRKVCSHWAFVPEAVVEWQAPSTLRGYWEKVHLWGRGDGEARLNERAIRRGLLRLGGAAAASLAALSAVALTARSRPFWQGFLAALLGLYLPPWLAFRGELHAPLDWYSELGAELARARGFREGLSQRPAALARRYQGVKGVFYILAGVPLDDIGGGPRGSQLAFELLSQGYAVVFLHKFPKYETTPLDLSIYHPHLFVSSLAEFDWPTFRAEHRQAFANKKTVALVEFPLPDFLPILRDIRADGGVVVYDLLDDWTTPLGGKWYHPAKEREIIAASQVLIATEETLKARLERISGRTVTLVANAVNQRLFDPAREHPRPEDLPPCEWVAIYVGSLWGDWFDWELLVQIAETYPEAGVVVIGDYRGDVAHPPANLHFLGLRPQFTLPGYLAHADVALIPRKVHAATQAMSPLKVYEYLAMRLPVVAPDLRPLRGIPGVLLAKDREDFVTKVGAVRSLELPEEEISRFIAANTWQARVEQILELIRAYAAR